MNQIQAQFSGYLGDFHIDVSFRIPAKGVTALFGPSGCGKTTVLRCIAGLHQMRMGYLKLDNKVWQKDENFVPSYQRSIGYVFQEPSLFPHLNVERNLTYGMLRNKSAKHATLFDPVVSLLGLEKLLRRNPNNLSGGERQRVAIGRALLSGPELLLMDEPLSALDHSSKNEIIPYLEKLHDELSIPMIYVSHDIHEIERIADNIVLMDEGRVLATGSLSDLLVDPQLPIIKRTDAATVFDGLVAAFDPDDHLTTMKIEGGELLIPGFVGEKGIRRRLRVFANDVSLSPERPSQTTILNILQAQIEHISSVGQSQIIVLCRLGDCGDGIKISARITKRSLNKFGFREGQKVFMQVKSVSLISTPTD